jgi:hypothetical protein
MPRPTVAYIRRNELHGVVDGHACSDGTARRIDVQPDIPLGVLGGEHEHLRADDVRVLILDLVTKPDNAFSEQSVENRVRDGRRIALLHCGR